MAEAFENRTNHQNRLTFVRSYGGHRIWLKNRPKNGDAQATRWRTPANLRQFMAISGTIATL
jgi:hypothetical protein